MPVGGPRRSAGQRVERGCPRRITVPAYPHVPAAYASQHRCQHVPLCCSCVSTCRLARWSFCPTLASRCRLGSKSTHRSTWQRTGTQVVQHRCPNRLEYASPCPSSVPGTRMTLHPLATPPTTLPRIGCMTIGLVRGAVAAHVAYRADGDTVPTGDTVLREPSVRVRSL